jgi:hypothetical protein
LRRLGVASVLVVAISVGCRSGERRVRQDSGVFLPETIGAISLEDVEAFRPEFRDAASAARLRIVQAGQNPSLSVVEMRNRSEDEVAIDVWPASMFGGPKPKGGGGRTLYFSRKAQKIVRGEAWQ